MRRTTHDGPRNPRTVHPRITFPEGDASERHVADAPPPISPTAGASARDAAGMPTADLPGHVRFTHQCRPSGTERRPRRRIYTLGSAFTQARSDVANLPTATPPTVPSINVLKADTPHDHQPTMGRPADEHHNHHDGTARSAADVDFRPEMRRPSCPRPNPCLLHAKRQVRC